MGHRETWGFSVVLLLLDGPIGDKQEQGDQILIYASLPPWWRKLEKSRGEAKSLPVVWGDSWSLGEVGRSVGGTGRQRCYRVPRALCIFGPERSLEAQRRLGYYGNFW